MHEATFLAQLSLRVHAQNLSNRLVRQQAKVPVIASTP